MQSHLHTLLVLRIMIIDNATKCNYRVSHSEMRDYKWLLGVEGSTLEPLLPQQPPWPQ